MKPKVLRTRDIRVVYFDEQENAKYPLMRTWGKATNNDVYWAVDFRRCLPGEKHGKSNVIIDIEDGLKKGLTVKDADSFLNCLRAVAPMNVIIVDNLNI
uniref:Uncharacterized protein n=1 Tax=Acrobeloides nanus TaxID=290746 RepID=A0A914D423_9BILA